MKDSEFGTILGSVRGGNVIRRETGEVVWVSSAFNPLNLTALTEVLVEVDKFARNMNPPPEGIPSLQWFGVDPAGDDDYTAYTCTRCGQSFAMPTGTPDHEVEGWLQHHLKKLCRPRRRKP